MVSWRGARPVSGGSSGSIAPHRNGDSTIPPGARYPMRTERQMTLHVLTGMSPDRVRGNLAAFSVRYVQDWEKWLLVPPAERAWLFASTLRSWQATRPLRMRRCRAEATHGGPHIEDLL